MDKLLIKVCGMRDDKNIDSLIKLEPDFIGLIFYEKSLRYVGSTPTEIQAKELQGVKKVGVFVNQSQDFIVQTIKRFKLDAIQLHGSESPEFCKELKNNGIMVIKAFSIANAEDLKIVASYDNSVHMNLLDTKTVLMGGSGRKFDWTLLQDYSSKTPFLLSGGIDDTDIDAILAIDNPLFAGIDLNSKFETEPAVKNIDKLERFFKKVRQYKYYDYE